jgi:biuret amidohydrolase
VTENRGIALLAHDWQNFHLGRTGSPPWHDDDATERLIANAVTLVSSARSASVPIVFTGHFLRDDGFDAVMYQEERYPGLLRASTPEADIIDELQVSAEDYLVRKGGGMSGFTGSFLDKTLRRLGTTSLIVFGGATHVGVDSTVRAATDLDYRCLVVDDACRDTMEHHRAALMNLQPWFARIISTAEAVEIIEDRQQP